MKKILIAFMLVGLMTSCAVNRYGVGSYKDLTKSELKSEFKNLKHTGVEDRSNVGHVLGGIATINYQNPADLAKSDNYIVTTKTAPLDILIGAVTGNLYSQSTIHVRSSKDSTTNKTIMSRKRKVSTTKFLPMIEAGYNHSINEYPLPSETTTRAEENVIPAFYVGIGYNAYLKNGLFFGNSILFEVNQSKFNYDGPLKRDKEINWTIDSSRLLHTLGLENRIGYKIDRFSIFSGVKAYGFVKKHSVGTTSYGKSGVLAQGDSWDRTLNGVNGVHFSIPVGISYDVNKLLSIQARYSHQMSNVFDENKLHNANLGITYKF